MQHSVVSREEWLAARTAFLAKEKEFTGLRDRLNAERRRLPWVRVEQEYVFDGPGGHETLADLFGRNSQLIIKHFMLAPGQPDPCVGCSFEMDHVDGILIHLENHDVSYAAVARAPYPEIAAVKERMGWHFKWLSSFGSSFNYDFHVSFTKEQIETGQAFYNYRRGAVPLEDLSGRSVFYKDENGEIFHTYSSFARGGDLLLGTYNLLDLTPKGRNEKNNMTDWVRHHDRYGTAGRVDASGRWVAADRQGSCCTEG